MSPLEEIGTIAHASALDRETRSSRLLRDPVFLMVNSLEAGGTERQFVETTRALRAQRIPIHVGCLIKNGLFADALGDLAEFPLGGSLYGVQALRSRWRLARHLRKSGVSIAHAFDFYTNLTLVPAAKLSRTAAVIGSHRQIGDLLTPAQFRAQLLAFHMCDRVLCNSHAAADRLLLSGLPQRKIRVIGNALPPESFLKCEPVLAPDPATVRIGMIARMNAEHKNHRIFLEAARIVSGRHPNVEFVLVGDGPLRPELENLVARLHLVEKVGFLGNRRDIRAILASLDISVVPSASESLSNVMLESMAAGVPVVATAIGGNIEVGGEHRAVLVPVNDAQSLAAALMQLVEQPSWRLQLARQSCEYVEENFSVKNICRQYEEFYADTLDEKRKRRRIGCVSSQPAINTRIRVALVAPSLRYVGGQAVQADLLIRSWNDDPALRAELMVVDPRFPRGLRWAENVPLLRTLIREPIYISRLWAKLKSVDVAHIFSASYTSFMLAPLPAWFVAKTRGRKTLINYRSGEGRDHLQHSATARYVLRHTDRLVVPSGYLVDVFHEFGLHAEVIPNIVDLSQFQYRVRRPLRPHLVCTRGFHPYYGIDVLVLAFAEVQKLYPDARLDLIGGGPLETGIRELVKNLRIHNVHFLGIASRNKIGTFYDAADIFVNASNLDNMPVSVLEAFAAGTPVVTTEPEGMKYIVSDQRTGLLSKPGDAAALATNIVRLLREPDLASYLAENAFEESKRYRWDAVREQWLRTYAELAPQSRKADNLDFTQP